MSHERITNFAKTNYWLKFAKTSAKKIIDCLTSFTASFVGILGWPDSVAIIYSKLCNALTLEI